MINHPNIVRLIEVVRKKDKLCLVFEFVDFSLLELIEKNPSGLKVAEQANRSKKQSKAMCFRS